MTDCEQAFERLSRVAELLRYKPGYTFSVWRDGGNEAVTRVSVLALPNSNEEAGAYVGVTISRTVDLRQVVSDFVALREFAAVIAAFELHEAAEWLKMRGHRVFQPHGKGDEIGTFNWTDFATCGNEVIARTVIAVLSEQ